MVKKSKLLAVMFAILIVASMAMAACSTTEEETTSDNATEASTSEESSDTTDSESTEAEEEPAEISLFLGSSGVSVPDDLDPADNPYINAIEELANVEITELIMPAYADFETQLNLLLASGDLPDLVHNYQVDAINEAGAAGAFLEVSDLIASSEVLSEMYTEEMLNLVRYSDGNIYQLRAIANVDPHCLCVRYDLILEINDGVIPSTIDEWYDYFVKIKEAYPDSVPFTDTGLGFATEKFMNAFGVEDLGCWQVTFGEYINPLEPENMTAAVEWFRKLYEEGLMSQTFVTNTSQDVANQRLTQQVAVWGNNLAACNKVYLQSSGVYDYSAWIIPVVIPTSGLDNIDVNNSVPSIGVVNWGHNVAISADTDELEGVVRFIETLLSDEVTEIFIYGIEGSDFEIVDGEYVMLEAALDTTYRTIYGFMWGHNTEDSVTMRRNTFLETAEGTEEEIEALGEMIVSQNAAVIENAAQSDSVEAADFVSPDSELQNAMTQAEEEAKSILMKAIVGEITMEEYEAEAAAFIEEYQYVTDELNVLLEEAKEKYGYE